MGVQPDGQYVAADAGPAGSDAAGNPSQYAVEIPQHDDSCPAPARSAKSADPVPWLIALAVFAAYVPISIFRYLRLDPASWDLGIFTEYAGLHAPTAEIKGPGFNLLGDHFHPIVASIAPFFRLFPSPVTLLVAQALLAAVSVIPVIQAAAERRISQLSSPTGDEPPDCAPK